MLLSSERAPGGNKDLGFQKRSYNISFNVLAGILLMSSTVRFPKAQSNRKPSIYSPFIQNAMLRRPTRDNSVMLYKFSPVLKLVFVYPLFVFE